MQDTGHFQKGVVGMYAQQRQTEQFGDSKYMVNNAMLIENI